MRILYQVAIALISTVAWSYEAKPMIAGIYFSDETLFGTSKEYFWKVAQCKSDLKIEDVVAWEDIVGKLDKSETSRFIDSVIRLEIRLKDETWYVDRNFEFNSRHGVALKPRDRATKIKIEALADMSLVGCWK